MKPTSLTPVAFAIAIAIAPTHSAAQANMEMGKMWTFENPPLAYLKEEYGFDASQDWLDALRLASLRYANGCSASFVSPKGLIMTNHHCVRGHVAEASPEGQDWVKTGFYASSMADEAKLNGVTVQQLVGMEDITAAMNAGVTDQDDTETAEQKRSANEAKILGAREDKPGTSAQIVKLHQGARYQLYTYRIFDDVRLVCAPHLQSAHFGGDPDNFTYPRYSIDFAFVRAYENDEPVDTSAHYFRWSTTGAAKDELVIVTGNPGSTDRLKTKAEMVFMRDAFYPIVRELIDNRLAIMRGLAKQSAELEQAMRTNILSLENAQKAYKGYHEGLLNPELMAQKTAAEAEFRERVDSNPELQAKFGDAWGRLEELAAVKTRFEPRRRFHSTAGSARLSRALAVVRACRAADAEEKDRLAKQVRSMPNIRGSRMDGFQRASFLDHLTRAARWLPDNDPFRQAVIADRTAEETLALIEQSAIFDKEFVDELLAGGAQAIDESTDPAVRMAAALEPLAKENAELDTWLNKEVAAQGTRIGQALFACYGDLVSPDATFTLRFSDGRAQGFPFNGTIAPYRTSFYGLFGRNSEFDNEYPFSLPQIWLDRMDKVDMTKSVNFVATNDIIGGNSGSPIVNADLEVVGLIFDGNIEMLANKFVYTDRVPRSVSVHVDAIMESLRKIYDADRIADELLDAGR